MANVRRLTNMNGEYRRSSNHGSAYLPDLDLLHDRLAAAGFKAGRDNVFSLAPSFGVDQLRMDDLGGVDGLIERTFNGLTIRINKNRSLERQRFSFAHELGHIVIGDHTGHREVTRTYTETERICDAIATEILMPQSEFSCRLGDARITIPKIKELADFFGTSIESTACRTVELTCNPTMLVIWAIRAKGLGEYPALRYVRRSNWSSYPFLTRNLVPRKGSSPSGALTSSGSVLRAESLLPSFPPVNVESGRFGSYVLSVIRPDAMQDS